MALATETFGEDGPTHCPNCRSLLTARFFPAIGRTLKPTVETGEKVLEGEAACFFHAEKRATVPCDRCGRFICPLCDVLLGTRHICPACLAAGIGTERVSELIARRWRWDNIALVIGLVPLILSIGLWPFFIASGPVAVWAAIFGWRRPGSLVRGRRRWVLMLGGLLGLVQIAIFVGMGIFLWQKGFNG